jgi:N-acetylglucosaminyldiphosphoundecaprenol N-acetyl-beta-D-mannosaminyltransferase
MQVLGIRIDNVTPQQALEQVSGWLHAPYTRLHQVVTLNAEGVMLAKADPQFAAVVAEADLVTPDGHGIVWAAAQYGEALKERVTGIDLLHELCRRGAAEGWRIYLLGSVDGVAAEAAQKLQQLYPGINIVGTHHGYFRGHEAELIETINQAQPELLFAALGVYWLVVRTGKEVSGPKIVELK